MEKLTVSRPIIVEGKYDKIKLDSVLCAHIIPVGGFSLFKKEELASLLRRLAEKEGVIVLVDPDGGGKQIRARLSQILPPEKVTHLHIPALPGKEKRKAHAGKAGLLGVEGMDAMLLRNLFLPFSSQAAPKACGGVTKQDFYRDGLSGKSDAKEKREALARLLDLPPDMTANALLDAINLLYTPEEYRQRLRALTGANE